MGWCSGTEIMDTALSAAEAVAVRVLEMAAEVDEGTRSPDVNPGPELDEVLRPFVTTIAKMLHAEDWDCVTKAHHFDRFQQEMYDFTDREYEEWLMDRLKWLDTDEERRDIVDRLEKLHQKMARSADGTG